MILLVGCAEPPKPLNPHAARDQWKDFAGASCMGGPVYEGASTPSTDVTIEFRDDMPATFVGTELCLLIDDQQAFSTENQLIVNEGLETKRSVTWHGSMSQGAHTLRVVMLWRAHGASYESRTAHDIAVTSTPLAVLARAFERGGEKTPLQDRPNIEWRDGP